MYNSGWSSLGSSLNNPCNSLAYFDNQIYAGGIFSGTSDNSVLFNCLAKWSTTDSIWQSIGGQTNINQIYSTNIDELGNLYIGTQLGYNTVNSYSFGSIARTYNDYVSLSYNNTILTNLFFNGQVTSVYTYSNSGITVGVIIPTSIQSNIIPG